MTRTHPAKTHRTMPALLALAAALALLWVGGFAWFLRTALVEPPAPPHADAIVALTGGGGRVETALRLLAEGRAQRLLISGVGGDAEFPELARLAGADARLGSRVTLGRAATSTRGNATETADWAHAKQIRSLIVVTAGYHMPRALAELLRALPGVAMYPVPVWPQALHAESQPARLRLFAGEYTKWLAAEVGLSALLPERGLAAGNRG